MPTVPPTVRRNRSRRASAPVRVPSVHATPEAPPVPVPVFDPNEIDVSEGAHRFYHEPLEAPWRALVEAGDGINGHPLDWALTTDPELVDTVVAVRSDVGSTGRPAWFSLDRPLREETFTSPLSGCSWSPDVALVRRLLAHTPYVVVRRIEDTVLHAFDVRTVEDPKAVARAIGTKRRAVQPASGAYSTGGHEVDVIAVRVPFAGDRFARSTRKRFQLAVPGGRSDATVEGAAARILKAHGYHVETPRLLSACYRMLVGEPIAWWWRDPTSVEGRSSPRHHPPGANPLEATQRGLDALARIQAGLGPGEIERIGRAVVETGRRPASYMRYVERIARFAGALGGAALAGCLEGILRGHRANHADLVAAHPGTQQAFLVEVKSKGDRLRVTQVESALWHARDGRCGYRLMKVDHPS